ncbi:MAG: PHP domain-containing protein [Bacteroidia bacterium]|nr:PHP domain-containing protein [Bacteroidia bacterium]MDW8347517.1 PHP domain-containing protein [Bacteroidia bacterium]
MRSTEAIAQPAARRPERSEGTRPKKYSKPFYFCLMHNEEIIRSFYLIIEGLEILEENPFRIKHYQNAVEKLENTHQSIFELHQKGQLETLDLGKSITEQLKTWLNTGKWAILEQIRNQIPEGVLNMLKLKGIGAKKVAFLWKELNITSIEALKKACLENKIKNVKGFGEKTQENILQSIKLLEVYQSKVRYNIAHAYMEEIIQTMQKCPYIDKIEPTKELRRKMETISTLSFIASTNAQAPLEIWLEKHFAGQKDIYLSTPYYWKGTYQNMPIEFFWVSSSAFAKKQFLLTGSAQHVLHFWSDVVSSSPQSEIEIYEKAGLPYIIPELREDIHAPKTPQEWYKLNEVIDLEHLRGTIHNHSTYSDGRNTLEEMAQTAKEVWKWEYLVIADHSKSSAFYANGMYENKVKEQWQAIDNWNAKNSDFYIFKGIECDILSDGSLDYEDDFRSGFEVVIASVHHNLNMDKGKATERLLKAIMHPHTNLLGHITGRLLLVREGYPIDYEAVIDACATYNVAIELNANPYRLDLDWRWLPYAVKKGVWISINPDAHSIKGYQDTIFGVYAARKGGLLRSQTLNALSLREFKDWLRVQHEKRSSA